MLWRQVINKVLFRELVEPEGAAFELEDILVFGEMCLKMRCKRADMVLSLTLHADQPGFAEDAEML